MLHGADMGGNGRGAHAGGNVVVQHPGGTFQSDWRATPLKIVGAPLEKWLYAKRKSDVDPQIRAAISLAGGEFFTIGFCQCTLRLTLPVKIDLPEEVWTREPIGARRLFVGRRIAPAHDGPSQIRMEAVIFVRAKTYEVFLDLGEFGREAIAEVRRKVEPHRYS